MKKLLLASFSALVFGALATPAYADNIANCELVLLEEILDENGNGGTQVASYRPAADFLASVYAGEDDIDKTVDSLKIRAVMCTRNDVIPTQLDFKVLATGIPFVLSQNFDSADSDLMTYYFKDSEFRYVHKGPDMSDEARETLEARMTKFNAQDHDLDEKEAKHKAEAEAEIKAKAEAKAKADAIAKASPEMKAAATAAAAIKAEEAVEQKSLPLEKRRDLE